MLLPAGLVVTKIPSPVVLSVLFSFLLRKRDLLTSTWEIQTELSQNLKTSPGDVYIENQQPLRKNLHLDNSTPQN